MYIHVHKFPLHALTLTMMIVMMLLLIMMMWMMADAGADVSDRASFLNTDLWIEDIISERVQPEREGRAEE